MLRLVVRWSLAVAVLASTAGLMMTSTEEKNTAMAAETKSTIYSHKVTSLSGEPVDLAKYQGKVVVFVNVASACGYTKQYKPLQEIYEKYKGQGLEVVGVPCNQFGGQEPGSADEIQSFCSNKYGVTFDLLGKTDVNGDKASPLYVDLKAQSPDGKGDIAWNFEKFVVSRDGKVVGRFKSSVKPDSKEFTDALEAALAQK